MYCEVDSASTAACVLNKTLAAATAPVDIIAYCCAAVGLTPSRLSFWTLSTARSGDRKVRNASNAPKLGQTYCSVAVRASMAGGLLRYSLKGALRCNKPADTRCVKIVSTFDLDVRVAYAYVSRSLYTNESEVSRAPVWPDATVLLDTFLSAECRMPYASLMPRTPRIVRRSQV